MKIKGILSIESLFEKKFRIIKKGQDSKNIQYPLFNIHFSSGIAGLQMMSFDFLNQGGSIQLQQLGSLVFYPFGFFQRLQDQRFFELGDSTV